MGRKNLLADLLGPKLTAVNSGESGNEIKSAMVPDPPRQPTLGARGAVGAMSRSLELMSSERDAAKALAEQVASGQHVVEIDTALIDPSIVQDRLPDGAGSGHAALVASIRDQGQLVPVLLRRHPDMPGRYQVAYGHRRVKALRELRRPVAAIVRALSDNDLVIAQGKENSDRRDLSFIERGVFAATLEERKF